jgi:hypothetical protein
MEWNQAASRFRWTVESKVDVDELELGPRAAQVLHPQVEVTPPATA